MKYYTVQKKNMFSLYNMYKTRIQFEILEF